MACTCGCDEENHLRDLPSGPASPNTFFEDFWAPNFVELLTLRLDTVLKEFEPSRRVLWRRNYGGDAQDIAPPRHKWAKRPTRSDESRGCGLLISRLPTPDFAEIMRQEELLKDWRRNSGDPGRASKRPCPNNKEADPQTSLPPAKKVTHNSSCWSEEVITSPSFPNDFNQPASRDSPWIKQEARGSTKRKAEAADLEDSFKTHKAFSSASTPKRCPCGCGEDAAHCLWLNVPPPPKTFFENTLAPKSTYMLDTRLNDAAMRFEPSRQTLWRPDCGGCALDRKRMASEIWTEKSDNWGNMFRIGPLPSDDVLEIGSETRFQSSRNRQRSTRSLSVPDRSLDGLASALPQDFTYGHTTGPKSFPFYKRSKRCKRSNEKNAEYGNHVDDPGRAFFRAPTVARKAKSSSSPTQFGSDKIPLKTSHSSRKYSPWFKREDLTVKKRQQLQQPCMQKLEHMRLKRHRQIGISPKRGGPLFAENRSLTFEGDNIEEVSSSIKAPSDECRTDEPQDWKQSISPKLEAMKSRQHSCHGTALDRDDSLATGFSPSTSHDLHVEEIPPNVKDLTKDFAADLRQQSLYQKIEALKLRRSRRQGVALYRNSDSAVETSSSTLQVDHEDISWIERKESTTDET